MLARLTTLALFAASCSFSGAAPDGVTDGGGEDGRIASGDAASADASVDSTALAACFSSYDDFTIGANKYEIIGDGTGLAYDVASGMCAQDGGRLVVLEDVDENSAVTEELRLRGVTSPACPNGGEFPCAWIGLKQARGSFTTIDGWSWADGRDLEFRLEWQTGEPNDAGDLTENGDEDCAQTIVNIFGAWNDDDCSITIPAVCECHSL